MSDTERTLAQLQALFPDNVTGNISPQDVRDLLVSLASEKILKAPSAPLYNDYTTSSASIAKKGGTTPTLKTFVGTLDNFAFEPSLMNEGFFEVHILHDFKAGSTPSFHVHWAHNNAAPSGEVVWKIDYAYAKGYGEGAFSAVRTLTAIQTAGLQYGHFITDDEDMPVDPLDCVNIEPDGIFQCRIYRDATNGADTFNDDAFLIEVDMHFEMAQHGTIERNRPFTSVGFPS